MHNYAHVHSQGPVVSVERGSSFQFVWMFHLLCFSQVLSRTPWHHGQLTSRLASGRGTPDLAMSVPPRCEFPAPMVGHYCLLWLQVCLYDRGSGRRDAGWNVWLLLSSGLHSFGHCILSGEWY